MCEGVFSGSSQSGVVAVELLVLLGLFVVVVVGSNRGVGALIGPVCGDEDVPGQARLGGVVGSRGGQVVGGPQTSGGACG